MAYPSGSLSEDVLTLILLVRWLELGEAHEGTEVIEFFAGVGRIALMARYAGFKSVAYDMSYGEQWSRRTKRRSPMDINSNAGLAPLDLGLSPVLHVCFYLA